MPKIIGIAVGSATHTVLWQGDPILNPDNEWQTLLVPNGFEAIEQIIELEPEVVAFAGSHRLAEPLAYALRDVLGTQTTIRYFPRQKMGRGVRENTPKFLRTVLGNQLIGRDFFGEKRIGIGTPPEEHPLYATAMEYHNATDEVRRGKHHLLSDIKILFPEAILPALAERKKGKPIPQPSPPDIWTKKMRVVLENPDPFVLADNNTAPPAIRALSKSSLGRYLPAEVRRRNTELHQEHLNGLRVWEDNKALSLERMRELVGAHPMIREMFPESDSALVLCAFLAWKAWPGKRHGWPSLVRFLGMDVSEIDSKGKSRISRIRPAPRQYLYLLVTRTKIGKEIAGEGRRVPRMERVLKHLWKQYLRYEWDPQTQMLLKP